MSTCRRHANLINVPPIKEKDVKTHILGEEVMSGIIKNHPKPPILSRRPAKIMEPETGASTWALGNHKCTLYMGNLTINEEIVIIIRINLKPVMISLWLD